MRSSLMAMAVAGAAVVAGVWSSQAAPLSVADLILLGGAVYTVEPDQPRAQAVAIREGRIVAVGTERDVARHRGSATRVIELNGAFVLPGLIDNHTHFNRAGELLLGINLLDVADSATLAQRVAAARDRLPPGAWILGGDWGAYEEWAMSSTGREGRASGSRFKPHRRIVDPITPTTPVLLSRWDRSEYLANAVALARAGITRDTPAGSTRGHRRARPAYRPADRDPHRHGRRPRASRRHAEIVPTAGAGSADRATTAGRERRHRDP